MELPEFVRILGRNFDIEFSDDALESNKYAVCKIDKRKIVLNSNPDYEPEILDSVVHEILHAVAWFTGLGLDSDVEERVIKTLTSGLVGVFYDNPDLVEWMLSCVAIVEFESESSAESDSKGS